MTSFGLSRLMYGSFSGNVRSFPQSKARVSRMDVPQVVLIDPDRAYRRLLADYLRAHDFNIIEVEGFDTFYTRVGDGCRAVIVMTLGADLAQGLAFLKFVATKYQCPILVRGDNDDETNRVICLELGADDTIRAGTSLREVLARVRAAVRRLQQRGPGPASHLPPSVREWRFLAGRRELIAPGGTPVPLTSAEFNLLNILVLNTGTPLDRDYLSRAVFGRVYSAMDRSIDNLVARLRRKLHDSARAPHMIKTARPVGYVFTGFPRAADVAPVVERSLAAPSDAV
jgi:two-component system OmpR family response regulator